MLKELKISLNGWATDDAEVYLSHMPDGWEDASIIKERSTTYWGVFTSFSLPMKFTKEAAGYLRKEFYHKGVMSEVDCTIEKLDKVYLDYAVIFAGKLDFATYKDQDNYVEIALINKGLSDWIKKNEDTEYEVPNVLRPGGLVRDVTVHPWGDELFRYGLNLFEALKWLVDLMTEYGYLAGTYDVASTILSGYDDNVILMNGLAWRTETYDPLTGAPDNAAVYRTTFKDFFKSVSMAIGPLGLGIELRSGKETLVIERLSYFFDDTQITDLGDVSDLMVSLNKDLNIQRIKIGYPEKEYDNTEYSLNEPNTTSSFTTKNFSVKKELDLTSKYRADWHGLTVVTENNSGGETDDSADDDIWFLEIDPSTFVPRVGYLKKKGTVGTVDLHNALLTPMRAMWRHLNFFEGCQYRVYADQGAEAKITFSAGGNDQRNNECATYLGGDWVYEWSSVNLYGTGGYFQPVDIQFKAPYPLDMIELIEAAPNGLIEFTYKGNTYYGYLLKIEVKLSEKSDAKYLLLSTHENELKNLIRNG